MDTKETIAANLEILSFNQSGLATNNRTNAANTQLLAFEFKWSDKSMKKIPRFFASNYPDSGFDVVHPANYLEFMTD
jgi:hypothetical protein